MVLQKFIRPAEGLIFSIQAKLVNAPCGFLDSTWCLHKEWLAMHSCFTGPKLSIHKIITY